MLKTECNTREMRTRVLQAARTYFNRQNLQADFEHGNWWITDIDTGAQWSVNDASGGDAVDGFCFEQVTEGEEA